MAKKNVASSETPEFELMDEENLKRVARIMGSNSASAKALADAEEKRKKGQEVVIVKVFGSNTLVVLNLDEEIQD